jgi:hypothetical protein
MAEQLWGPFEKFRLGVITQNRNFVEISFSNKMSPWTFQVALVVVPQS